MQKRFSDEQIIGFLWGLEAGLPIKELCLPHGFSEASYFLWRCKFGGMCVSDVGVDQARPPAASPQMGYTAYTYNNVGAPCERRGWSPTAPIFRLPHMHACCTR